MVSTVFADPTRQLEDDTGMQLVAQCPWSRHHEANEDISHLYVHDAPRDKLLGRFSICQWIFVRDSTFKNPPMLFDGGSRSFDGNQHQIPLKDEAYETPDAYMHFPDGHGGALSGDLT
jgi:hypothetical protein